MLQEDPRCSQGAQDEARGAQQPAERQAGGRREGNGLGKCVGEFERVLLFRGVGGAGRERAGARV